MLQSGQNNVLDSNHRNAGLFCRIFIQAGAYKEVETHVVHFSSGLGLLARLMNNRAQDGPSVFTHFVQRFKPLYRKTIDVTWEINGDGEKDKIGREAEYQ